MTMDQDEQFVGKYENSGRIGSALIDNFYRSVKELLVPCMEGVETLHEVGCGAGYSTHRLRQWMPSGVNLTASDVGESLIAKARARNPGVQIENRSAYALGFPEKSIDVVVMMEVLEHLESPVDALRELARVARRNVLISTPREPVWRMLNLARGKYVSALGNTPGHINHWSSGGLRKLASHAFEVEAQRQPLPWTILRLRPR